MLGTGADSALARILPSPRHRVSVHEPPGVTHTAVASLELQPRTRHALQDRLGGSPTCWHGHVSQVVYRGVLALRRLRLFTFVRSVLPDVLPPTFFQSASFLSDF